MQDQFRKLLSRPSSDSAVHHVVVVVGGETFGVPASQIQEIMGLGDMDPTPRLPKQLTGPVRLNNKMIFLVKIQASFARLRTESEVSPRTCVLVLKGGSAIGPKVPRGVVVDKVERIVELDERDVETVTTRRKGMWASCTLGFIRRHLPIILLDLEELVSSESTDGGLTLSETSENAAPRSRRKQEE